MIRLAICLLLFFFFSQADVSAQKHKLKSMEWDIAGILPSTNGRPVGFAGPVTGVNADVLMVGGGSNFPDSMPWLGGRKKYYDDLYVYKKNSHDSLVLYRSFKLPFALGYVACVSTANGIVVAGGENENGISSKVLLIQWNETKESVDISNLPDLPFAVTNAAAVIYNKKVFLAGGEMKEGVSTGFIFLDLENTAAGWQQLQNLPQPTSHAVMAVQSKGKHDCIYLVGGRKKNAGSPSDLYASNFQFDLITGKWTEKKPLPHNLSAGTGVEVGDHSILIFGGDNGKTFHATEELIFAIANASDQKAKEKLTAEKIKVQSTHPGFCKQVLLYDTKKDKWSSIACIPFDSPVTTTAIKWNNEVLIPGGEIRAGVRTTQILRTVPHIQEP